MDRTSPEKPRDRARTRERILAAAKTAFASDGYARANIRDIAAEAGITPALVVRYFGSKEKLFAEAVADSFDLVRSFADVERGALGSGFVEMLFSEQRSDDLLAMMVRAAADPAVQPLVRHLVQVRMLEPMTTLLGGAGARQRAALVLSIMTGLWLYRFLLPIAPLTDGLAPAERHRIATLIQSVIDGEGA